MAAGAEVSSSQETLACAVVSLSRIPNIEVEIKRGKFEEECQAGIFSAGSGPVYSFAGESVARDAVIFNFSELNEDEGKDQFQSMKLRTSKPDGFAAATEAC